MTRLSLRTFFATLVLGVALPSLAEAEPTSALGTPGPRVLSGGRGTFSPPGAKAPRDQHGRVASVRYITWIYERPDLRSRRLGYVRAGTSIAIREPGRVKGWGNCNGFYSTQPRGYVCNDDTTTTDMGHPVVRASKHVRPADSVRPYRYALSLGAPMYNRVPTTAAHARVMKRHRLPKQLVAWAKKYEGLATNEKVKPTDEPPDFLRGGRSVPTPFTDTPALVRKSIPQGSVLAYTKAFEMNGQVWLLSSDLTVVPASHMRPFRASRFEGVWLSETGAKLPIAWMRESDRPKLVRSSSGAFEKSGESWPRLAWVALTGKKETRAGRTYLETRDGAHWIARSDATVSKRRARPKYVGPKDQWIVVSVSRGTLTAYQGDRPEFATLMSPGSGGVQPKGGDPVKLSTTPLGSYRVNWKDRAAGMSPDKGDPTTFWISDVPWTMYFQAPFAIHAAFWHEEFGQPKSGGCINLSPRDARKLFDWAGPDIPEGWQGVAGGGSNGSGTHVIVTP